MSKSGAVRYFVSGRVQGVGFRYSAQRRARGLGLTGYVRNRADGRVELWAEGDADALATLDAWLRKGPPTARVEGVEREVQSPSGSYTRFTIR